MTQEHTHELLYNSESRLDTMVAMLSLIHKLSGFWIVHSESAKESWKYILTDFP